MSRKSVVLATAEERVPCFDENVVLDFSHLRGKFSDSFLHSILSSSERIRGLRLSGCSIENSSIDILFRELLQHLRYLEYLDVAYISLSFHAQCVLWEMINPLIFGYCPILHLNVSRSGLGIKGSIDLFTAIAGNITMKELIINGNDFGDKTIPSLIQFLKNPDNVLEVLSISHNNITERGMKDLSSAIGSHKYLLELYIDGNPIQSSGVGYLFSKIWKSQMKFVSLSNCEITSCEWSSQLIYMTNLESLILSYNQIHGSSLQHLCDGLQQCACIRHLNLSNNNLQTIQASCIGQLIKVHKGLISLDLSGNLLTSEVIAAIVLGIYGNCTLRTLNLSWCHLTEHHCSLLCNALAENSLLDLILRFNPIPDEMKVDPRKSMLYLSRRSDIELRRHSLGDLNRLDRNYLINAVLSSGVATTSSSGAVAEEEEHLEFAFIDGLTAEIASELWRKQKLNAITLSKQAFEDASQLVSDFRDEYTHEDSTSETQDAELMLHIDPVGVAEKAKKHLISGQSPLVDVLDGKLILSVSYGRRNEVLGSIEVTEKMTYYETRQLIRPLLESYFLSSERNVLERAYNFKLLDGLGFVLTEEAEKVRIAWAELSTSGHSLHLQPPDWLYIPKDLSG